LLLEKMLPAYFLNASAFVAVVGRKNEGTFPHPPTLEKTRQRLAQLMPFDMQLYRLARERFVFLLQCHGLA
jgi:hypothetical protein